MNNCDRRALLASLLAVSLSLVFPQAATAATGIVTISPATGPPGTVVSVTVKGFTPSPSTPNGSGHLYPYEITFDGFNFSFPGTQTVTGYSVNPGQPFTHKITIPSTVAAGSTHTINYQHSGNDTSADAIFTVTGPASNLAFASGAPQVLTTGAASSAVKVQLRDSFGTPVRAGSGGMSVTLSSTSAGGKFSASTSFSNPVTSMAVAQGSDSATFHYRDTVAGTPTLTASRSNLTSATTGFTINPPAVTAPAAPSKVGATPLSSSLIHLSWRPSPGATGYNVFVAASAAGPFTTKANTLPVTSPFLATGLLSNKAYFYKIGALNTAGSSPLSSPPASATTTGPALGANATLSDAASCVGIGGIAGLPGIGFAGDTCTMPSFTIESGATLTISNNITLINTGVITNTGTMTNSGGIIYNKGGSTISNAGTITNNYGSTVINNGSVNNWCGATLNKIGSWASNQDSDVCATSTVQSASMPNETVTFTTSPGRFAARPAAIAESTLPTSGKPSGITFPFGFFSWTVTDLAPGQTITVGMTFQSNVPSNAQFWKVINGSWTNVTALLGDHDGDKFLTLTIRDGGLEDEDTIAGQVTDPGGFAIVAPASAAATPVYWLVLIVAFMGVVTWVTLKQRPRPARVSAIERGDLG